LEIKKRSGIARSGNNHSKGVRSGNSLRVKATLFGNDQTGGSESHRIIIPAREDLKGSTCMGGCTRGGNSGGRRSRRVCGRMGGVPEKLVRTGGAVLSDVGSRKIEGNILTDPEQGAGTILTTDGVAVCP